MPTLGRDSEAFIPFRRKELVESCLEEGLSSSEAGQFRRFCDLLATYLHLEMQEEEQVVDEHYGPFDPDRDTISLRDAGSLANHEARTVECFERIAARSNYFAVTTEDLEECFEKTTFFKLRTKVNLDDFDRIVCFARGDINRNIESRKWRKTRTVEVDIYQRVLLLLKYKDESHFGESRSHRGIRFKPGKIYAFFYKDVPKYDLELLFPNVEVGMTTKDRLALGVPALGGLIFVLIKVLPQLLIVIGVLLFLAAGPKAAESIGISDDSVSDFMPVLTALMGLTIAFGGLAFKQWTAYRKKKIEFLKVVTEQLFFRNLATNRSVFHRMIASACEEESKEMMLVLYHLWSAPDDALTRSALDERIENWMKEKLDSVIDFDIENPVRQLCEFRGTPPGRSRQALLRIASDGTLEALPLADAVALLEQLVVDRAVRKIPSSQQESVR